MSQFRNLFGALGFFAAVLASAQDGWAQIPQLENHAARAPARLPLLGDRDAEPRDDAAIAAEAARSICRQSRPQLAIDNSGAPEDAEFQIGVDGAIVRRAMSASDANSVSFFSERPAGSAGWRIIVRVDAISTAKAAGRATLPPAQCGVLEMGQRIKLDPAVLKNGADQWRLRVHFTSAAADALQLGQPQPRSSISFTDRFAKVQADEEARIFAQMTHELEDAAVRIRCNPAAPALPGTTTPTANTPANECPIDANLISAIESFTHIASGQIGSLHQALDADSQSLKQYPVAQLPLSHLRDALKDLRQKALRVKEQKSTSYVTDFTDAWEQFQQRGKASRDANELNDAPGPDCGEVWLFNVQKNPALSTVWPFGMFELPTTPPETTIILPANGVTPQKLRLTTLQPVSAWATYLPPDTKTAFSWAASDSTAPDGIKAFGTFIAVLARLQTGTAPQAISRLGFAPRPPLPGVGGTLRKPLPFSELTSQSRCEAAKPASIESPLAPMARYEARLQTSAMLGEAGMLKDRVYTVSVCAGSCAISGQNPTVLAKTQLATPAGWGLTLLGALAYDVPLRAGGQFTSLEWRPTTASGANQQIFEVAETQQPLQSLSTSLLLTLLFPEGRFGRVGLGAGPSIVFGNGSGVLKQWSLNVVYQPPSLRRKIFDKLFLMAGIGFRLIDTPIAQQVGDTIALDRANGQDPQPPAIATRMTEIGVFSVGIALDLSLISDAAISLFGIKPAAN